MSVAYRTQPRRVPTYGSTPPVSADMPTRAVNWPRDTHTAHVRPRRETRAKPNSSRAPPGPSDPRPCRLPAGAVCRDGPTRILLEESARSSPGLRRQLHVARGYSRRTKPVIAIVLPRAGLSGSGGDFDFGPPSRSRPRAGSARRFPGRPDQKCVPRRDTSLIFPTVSCEQHSRGYPTTAGWVRLKSQNSPVAVRFRLQLSKFQSNSFDLIKV